MIASDFTLSPGDEAALHRLIEGPHGASLEVTWPGGHPIVAPLAPCFRCEPGGLIWLLPLPPAADGLAEFDLSVVRRRGFQARRIRRGPSHVALELVSGATVTVREAEPDQFKVIEAWREFTDVTLSGDQRAAVHSLRFDTF